MTSLKGHTDSHQRVRMERWLLSCVSLLGLCTCICIQYYVLVEYYTPTRVYNNYCSLHITVGITDRSVYTVLLHDTVCSVNCTVIFQVHADEHPQSHTYKHTYTCMCMCGCSSAYVCVHIGYACIHTHRLHTYTHIQFYMLTCAMYAYTCMRTHMLCVHTHTHRLQTHTHVHAHICY